MHDHTPREEGPRKSMPMDAGLDQPQAPRSKTLFAI